MECITHQRKGKKDLDFCSSNTKIQVPIEWTKYLLVTHPIEFITTICKIKSRIRTNIAPFATCLDTSYNPPYVTFAAALKQHSIQGEPQRNSRMNTYLNIKQNGLFIVNVPDRVLLPTLDIISHPYQRKDLEDKILRAKLTKVKPFILPEKYGIYPPLINECLAHLECEVVDIHRPNGSDHYLITGRVVGASYDKSLGEKIDELRLNLAKRVFHHFGASSENPSMRYFGYIQPASARAITFKLEEKVSKGVKR